MDPRGLKREGRDSLGLQYLERVPGVACWRSRSSEGVLVLAGVLALFLSFFRSFDVATVKRQKEGPSGQAER